MKWSGKNQKKVQGCFLILVSKISFFILCSLFFPPNCCTQGKLYAEFRMHPIQIPQSMLKTSQQDCPGVLETWFHKVTSHGL